MTLPCGAWRGIPQAIRQPVSVRVALRAFPFRRNEPRVARSSPESRTPSAQALRSAPNALTPGLSAEDRAGPRELSVAAEAGSPTKSRGIAQEESRKECPALPPVGNQLVETVQRA